MLLSASECSGVSLSASECAGVSLSAAERRLKILVVLDNAASTDVVATLSSCGLNLLVTTRRSQIAPDRSQLAPDRSRIAPDRSQLAPDRSQLAPDRSQIAPDRSQIAPDRSQIAPDRSQLAPDRSQIAPDRSQLAPDRSQIAPDQRGALIIEVGPVDDATARQILERGASSTGKEARLPVDASAILEACAGLPLALALAAALCRGGDEGAWVSLAAEWADTRRKLDEILPDEASTQFTQVQC